MKLKVFLFAALTLVPCLASAAPGTLRNIDVKGYALGSAVTNRPGLPASPVKETVNSART